MVPKIIHCDPCPLHTPEEIFPLWSFWSVCLARLWTSLVFLFLLFPTSLSYFYNISLQNILLPDIKYL
jgi:hypothetical protein